MCVARAVSISASASTHPSAIALRYLQRKAIMMDPHWKRGHYYTQNVFPRFGMKLARSVRTDVTQNVFPRFGMKLARSVRIDVTQNVSALWHEAGQVSTH